MTSLVNPNATQSTNYGGILSEILGAYTQVSLARVNSQSEKYKAAADIQRSTLSAPQSTGGMLDALGIGNAVVPGTNANGVARSGGVNVVKVVAIGVAGVAGFLLIKKMLKR